MKEKIDLNKLNILKIIITIGIIFFLLYTFYFDIIQNVNKEVSIYKFKDSEKFFTLTPGDEKEYNFSNQTCKFDEINFLLGEYNNINLNIKIINTATGEECYNKDITNDFITIDDEKEQFIVSLDLEKVFQESDYTITIKNIGIENVSINILDDSELNISIILHSNLGIKIAIATLLIIIIYIVIITKFIDYNKIELHQFFLISIIPLSVIYFILYVPWSVPDTEAHYSAMYRFSNFILEHSNENEWNIRKDDNDFLKYIWIENRNAGMDSYAEIIHNYSIFTDKTEIQNSSHITKYMNYYSFVNYWPQVIGIVIGRLINLSAISTVYLARIFILSFYIVSCYRAIKRTPIGKSVFLLVSLLPMSLMISSGMTYDVMVFITTQNLVSSIFVLYKKEYSRRDIIEAGIWAFMVGAVKGGGYLLILPLAFILLDSTKNKKSIGKVLIIILSGIFSVILFDILLQWNNHLYQFGTDGNGKMSASFAFQYPIEYMKLCVNTYLENFDFFIFSMLGTNLGLLEHIIPYTLIIILILPILILAVIEKDDIELMNKDKWICLFVVFLAIIFTPMMLLSWTNNGSKIIEGIQGRYYLPILSISLILVTKFLFKEIKVSKQDFIKYKAKCLQYFGILSCICIYFIERIYLLR